MFVLASEPVYMLVWCPHFDLYGITKHWLDGLLLYHLHVCCDMCQGCATKTVVDYSSGEHVTSNKLMQDSNTFHNYYQRQ